MKKQGTNEYAREEEYVGSDSIGFARGEMKVAKIRRTQSQNRNLATQMI